jgi:hypothetical protein
MSKESRESFENLVTGKTEPTQTAAEAVVKGVGEALGAFATGAIDAAYSGEMKHFAEHGAQELSNALFGTGPFVLYPKEGKNEASQEESKEQGKGPDMSAFDMGNEQGKSR